MGCGVQPRDPVRVRRPREDRPRRRRLCLRAAARQRHLRRRSRARHAGAERRLRAGAGQRRVLRAHPAHPRTAGHCVRRAAAARRRTGERGRARRGARARRAHHARRAGTPRNQRRPAESARCDRGRLPAPRQGTDRRCDEFVRRVADRSARQRHRRAGVGERQVSGRGARHGLRDRAAQRARRVGGPLAVAGARPARPVRVSAQDHAMALHAAHARGRRAAQARSTSSSPKAASPRAARATRAIARRSSTACARSASRPS